ncbi:MAG: polysaccharide deacetylase family protein, partial [Deltaproteobacteria bacterium]|nr:polysaccharide deacetylase family protein [Deltaproteobacteria bacterium]
MARTLPTCLALLLAALCAGLGVRPAWAATVPNPGFEAPNEDGSGPADWKPSYWGLVTAEFEWTTTGHVGRGARVQVTSSKGEGDARWYGTDFEADGTDIHYRVSDWYRSDVPSELILWVGFADGEYAYLPVASLPAAATWTLAQADLTIPPGALSLQVLHTIHDIGYLEIDDVTCEGLDGSALGPGAYQATVSFTFDDGWLSAYNMLTPQLDQRGWKATHFLITDYPEKPGYQSDFITVKQIHALLDRCHEVASHTVTHPDLATLPPAEVQAELSNSLQSLKGWGITPFGLALPFGSTTPAVTEQAGKLYSYVRTMNPDINKPPYPVHALNGHVMGIASTAYELELLLRRAEHVDGGWVILVFHRASNTPPGEDYVTMKQFKGFLEVVAQHNAKVETIAQHLGLSKCVEVVKPPPVIGDKSLDPPEPATKATAPATAADDAGCQASAQAQSAGVGLALLVRVAALGL